jgi:hypothetical protein
MAKRSRGIASGGIGCARTGREVEVVVRGFEVGALRAMRAGDERRGRATDEQDKACVSIAGPEDSCCSGITLGSGWVEKFLAWLV